jgi:hypothetical protein
MILTVNVRRATTKAGLKMNLKTLPFFFISIAIIFLTMQAKNAHGNGLLTPEFSAKHGFYQTSFDLIVSSLTANAAIKYTLDGSDPFTSSTALLKSTPATIRIDPESTEGQRAKTPAVVLRTCVFAPDSTMSEIITQTYLFVNKVKELSPDGIRPSVGWPNPTVSASPQAMDYGLDPDVLKDSRYKNLIDGALLDIPTISMVTDLKNLFALNTGIYMNAYQDGKAWERPASIELLNPDGSEGFRIDAGIRIRGGASRDGSNPKHAFRFFFRSEYGQGTLKFPLFENEGVDRFDNVDLRTGQNYSWSFPGHQGEYNTMITDVFSRNLQREMGQPYTRSRFYHLYLNGVYWGLYQTQERPEASFAASYFGGNAEDYDVIKAGDGWPSSVEATDGNLNAYRDVWNISLSGLAGDANYFKLQGLNPDGTRNPNYKALVDIDNLIDFMLIVFYTGNFDCPISKFGQNNTPRNFYCIYNRNGQDGFKFIIHDAEHALRTTAGEGPGIGLYENRVNIGTLTDGNKMVVNDFMQFHPQWLHFKLSDNAEYRIRFADHVYKHFFNQGCMTPEKATALFQFHAQEIEMAIIGESARWGDTYHNPPRTKDDDWLWAVNDIIDNYFPKRTAIVLSQLKGAGLYPGINPPLFKDNEEEISSPTLNVEAGHRIKIQKPSSQNGILQYTVDGQDPRSTGGNIAYSARNGGSEVEVIANATTVIKARILNGTTWSALHEIVLFIDDNANIPRVTEIHYHPLDGDTESDNKYEFLELKNIGTTPINLSQAFFSNGITFTFPSATFIDPDKFIVLASDLEEFNKRYGFLPFGEYAGQLDNGGETIALCKQSGDTLFSMTYKDQAPWPELADGGGYSLVTKETNFAGDLNDPTNWRASYNVNGSPGQDDLPTSSIPILALEEPGGYELEQNYPNPFNPSTRISYTVKSSGKIRLSVFDVLGREVALLVDDVRNAGRYEAVFTGAGLPGGIYLYKLQSQDGEKIKKAVLVR